MAKAGDGQEAVIFLEEIHPDVILMDLRMPGVDDIEATIRSPAGSRRRGILVLTSFAADNEVFPAIKQGATGYLLREC